MTEQVNEKSPAKAKAEVETVKMDDERIVEFVGKRRMNKDTSFDGTNIYVRIDFRNGETRTFKAAHGLTLEQIDSKEGKFLLKAAGHGLEQKLGDEASGVKELDDAIEAIDQLMVRLDKGHEGWTQGKEEGQGLAGASVLARALVEVTGNDIRAVREYLMTLDAKTKLALRGDAAVAPVIKRIEDERAARAESRGKKAVAVDTASILAGLKKAEPAAEAA